MTIDASVTEWSVRKYSGDDWTLEEDTVASEYPLTVFVNDTEFATLVCSPSDLEEMTVGFLASEGAIRSYGDIAELSIDTDRGFAYVGLVRRDALDPALFSKRRIGSCCGKSRQSYYFHSDAQTAHPIRSTLTVDANRCYELMRSLHAASDTHRLTGGVHGAALCGETGITVHYADIGRHNALDKLYGHCLMHGLSAADRTIAFSGRLSSEVVLKAVKIGSPVLLSKSAPTDLGLRLADELGLTAVGFLRGGSMNVYTHPERIATHFT
ncbi:formate dehydrogenase accessory sulfurtransferase FdhD [Paenibacillus mesophilus]|uniref:formate dehydrogenase accessory sulfurtransferase FdhD n=1 Tax=Paenibacillus mesophilus TaxID=2582849 RepID=UPI00110E68FA|nr:formate dehydrogenase accessory sulfurtransferase FdhD [Paenibacillus mesophilus]TMV46155.1 formate dehydrogenase accessory sulfurtransferase FdhD [Paenibacillus mesophilus]